MKNTIEVEKMNNYSIVRLTFNGKETRISVPDNGDYMVVNSVFSNISISPKTSNEFTININDK